MPVPAPKRKKIEAELGRSLKSFLKEKLAEGLTPNLIGRKIHLDPSTVRYYIRKFKLPYSLGKKTHKPPRSPEKKLLEPPRLPEKKPLELLHSLGKKTLGPPRSPEKKPRSSQFQAAHLDICLCPLCLEIPCMEGEETHKFKRCVIICVDFRKKRKDERSVGASLK